MALQRTIAEASEKYWILPLLAIVCFACVKVLQIGRRPSTFPPGPPTVPVLGNLHLIPRENAHLQFQKWAEEYGPIYSLIIGTRKVIVLNTDQTVKDLLDRKGGIYSSRPNSYITDVSTGGLNFGMMKNTEKWRMCRHTIQSSMTAKSVELYAPYQNLEIMQLLHGLLEEPSIFKDHIRRYTNSLMTQLVFGFRTIDNFDPKLIQLYDGVEAWSKLIGQATTVLIDLFPPLRYLPDVLLPVRKHAQSLHDADLRLYSGHFFDTRDRIRAGTSHPCIAMDILKFQRQEGFSDDLASYICGGLLFAGSDTTSTQLTVFMKAMVLYPEVQRTAQAEIDRVCGDRLPEKTDHKNLPYIHALIKEVCRWMPTAILGVPHATLKDDEYMGYFIPKETAVIMNVWAIHNDPQRHRDPRIFDPTRYLHDRKSLRESALSADATERDQFLFGAGRRLCAGMNIAEDSLFLTISRILWAFNVSKAIGADGSEITPDADSIVEGLLVSPADFPARVLPRSAQREGAVRAMWKVARENLSEVDGQWNHVPSDLPFAK